jgi:pyruvate/2-oxoglutarate dehydrogenase complex dihydrolipoamide dehydrogenase (E3) component
VIFGVQIIGPRPADLIADHSLASGMEATLDAIIATIHAHTTVREALRAATLAAKRWVIHIQNSIDEV